MNSNTFFGSSNYQDYIPIPMGDNDMTGYTKASYDNGSSSNNTTNGGKSGVESSSAAASQSTSISSITIPQEQTFATPALTPGLSTPLAPNYNNEFIQEFLPPLESPAATPNYTEIFQFLDSTTNENYFTPLTSPALPPNQENYNVDNLPFQFDGQSDASAAVNQYAMNTEQRQQQQQQQQQLNRSHVLPTNTTHSSPLALLASQRTTPSSPLAFEAFSKSQAPIPPNMLSANTPNRFPTAPATPASLMNLNGPNNDTINHNLDSNNANQRLQHPFPSSASSSASAAVAAAAAVIAASRNASQIHAHNVSSGIGSSSSSSSSVSAAAVAAKKRKIPISSSVMNKPSPRALRPSISPFLQPNLHNAPPIVGAPAGSAPVGTVVPTTTPNSLSTMDNRRSAHKVAEQRRRDIMKQSFDSLREEIIDVLMADTKKSRIEVERDVKFMSKIVLLKHSYEYIVRLKKETKSKDEKMAEMQAEIDRLKAQAGETTTTTSIDPSSPTTAINHNSTDNADDVEIKSTTDDNSNNKDDASSS